LHVALDKWAGKIEKTTSQMTLHRKPVGNPDRQDTPDFVSKSWGSLAPKPVFARPWPVSTNLLLGQASATYTGRFAAMCEYVILAPMQDLCQPQTDDIHPWHSVWPECHGRPRDHT
jgi:hypothetical protein